MGADLAPTSQMQNQDMGIIQKTDNIFPPSYKGAQNFSLDGSGKIQRHRKTEIVTGKTYTHNTLAAQGLLKTKTDGFHFRQFGHVKNLLGFIPFQIRILL